MSLITEADRDKNKTAISILTSCVAALRPKADTNRKNHDNISPGFLNLFYSFAHRPVCALLATPAPHRFRRTDTTPTAGQLA
jgi:hypothetical protein